MNDINTNSINMNTTTTTVHRLEYTWKIDHFSYYNSKESDFDSPVFAATSDTEYKWRLKLKFIDDGSNATNYIGLYVVVDHTCKNGTIFAKYKFAILDNDEEVRRRICDKIRGFKLRKSTERGWGFKKFIPKDDLFNGELLSNDQLKVYCSIIFSEANDFTEDFNQIDPLPRQPNGIGYTLSEDFGALLTSKDYSDIVLVVSDKKFYVHKSILAARSPVFNAMFKTPLLENERNCVEIKDLDNQVVEQMLRYIYTAKCDKLEEFAEDLFVAADKYDLRGLKFRCETALYKNLSVENATRRLILADLHRANKLKSHVIHFIVTNSREVVTTPTWDEMVTCFPQLLNEVFKASLSQTQQADTSVN